MNIVFFIRQFNNVSSLHFHPVLLLDGSECFVTERNQILDDGHSSRSIHHLFTISSSSFSLRSSTTKCSQQSCFRYYYRYRIDLSDHILSVDFVSISIRLHLEASTYLLWNLVFYRFWFILDTNDFFRLGNHRTTHTHFPWWFDASETLAYLTSLRAIGGHFFILHDLVRDCLSFPTMSKYLHGFGF